MASKKRITQISFVRLYMQALAEGKTASDLCQELGMSKPAFRFRVFRLRKDLRKVGTRLPRLRRSPSVSQLNSLIQMATIVECGLAAKRSYKR